MKDDANSGFPMSVEPARQQGGRPSLCTYMYDISRLCSPKYSSTDVEKLADRKIYINNRIEIKVPESEISVVFLGLRAIVIQCVEEAVVDAVAAI